MTKPLALETVWLDKYIYGDAEAAHFIKLAGNSPPVVSVHLELI